MGVVPLSNLLNFNTSETFVTQTTINPALIKTVAQEAGVKLAPRELYSDSIGAKGSEGDSYIKMMTANTRTIVEALGGKYNPYPQK